MSQRKGSRKNWKPRRERREIVTAVLASLTVIVVTAALVWFLRPNRDSGSTTPVGTVSTPTTIAAGTSTTLPVTTAPVTTAPTATSTP